MQQDNPYSPPQATLDSDHSDPHTLIDSLAVSDTWKRRFRLMSKAGGARLPHMSSLSKEERKELTPLNVLAFLFGPFYYAVKGMWKKGVLMALAVIVVVGIIQLILFSFGLDSLARATSFGGAAVFAARANIDFYKKMVLGDESWW